MPRAKKAKHVPTYQEVEAKIQALGKHGPKLFHATQVAKIVEMAKGTIDALAKDKELSKLTVTSGNPSGGPSHTNLWPVEAILQLVKQRDAAAKLKRETSSARLAEWHRKNPRKSESKVADVASVAGIVTSDEIRKKYGLSREQGRQLRKIMRPWGVTGAPSKEPYGGDYVDYTVEEATIIDSYFHAAKQAGVVYSDGRALQPLPKMFADIAFAKPAKVVPAPGADNVLTAGKHDVGMYKLTDMEDLKATIRGMHADMLNLGENATEEAAAREADIAEAFKVLHDGIKRVGLDLSLLMIRERTTNNTINAINGQLGEIIDMLTKPEEKVTMSPQAVQNMNLLEKARLATAGAPAAVVNGKLTLAQMASAAGNGKPNNSAE